jgi:universal stress protein A
VLITAAPGWPIRRVLVAVDLSFAAEPTLAAARDLARASDARVRVLHVIEPVAAAPIMAPGIDLETIAQRDIEEFRHRVAAIPEIDVQDQVVRRGPPAQTIATEATDWDADVVVMGSHGRGWVERLLVGSVTEHVLALLPASVLVVPVHAHAAAAVTGSVPEATGALP